MLLLLPASQPLQGCTPNLLQDWGKILLDLDLERWRRAADRQCAAVAATLHPVVAEVYIELVVDMAAVDMVVVVVVGDCTLVSCYRVDNLDPAADYATKEAAVVAAADMVAVGDCSQV